MQFVGSGVSTSPSSAKLLTDAIQANAETLATSNDLQIAYVRKEEFPQ
jgi:hypothetical protein